MLSLYERAWRPVAALLARSDAETAHAATIAILRRADAIDPLCALAAAIRRRVLPDRPIRVGGVDLPGPLILAAGLVKGDGFADESSALAAVDRHRHIVAGWRSAAALLGPIEMGSFTRYPRLGNSGRVLWRDMDARSMHNRVGLRNPGARAAARYLRIHARQLPASWGVNLAVSPGVDDAEASAAELGQAAGFFADAFDGLPNGPAWYTLNLSCPNTQDDPRGHQTESMAERATRALASAVPVPVWVKIGPDLSTEQIAGLVRAAARAGARAIVATNTLPAAAPGNGPSAGLSGAPLRSSAMKTVRQLRRRIDEERADLEIVACGGIMHGDDLRAFEDAGARAAMLYSALVFRGPLAPALILQEADGARRRPEVTAGRTIGAAARHG